MKKKKVLGSYNSNAYLIEIPYDNSINMHSSLNLTSASENDISTFLHEYFHYLINISTFHGILELSLYNLQKYLFSHTMKNRKDGESDGSAVLEKSQKEELDSLFKIIKIYYGDSIDLSWENTNTIGTIKQFEERISIRDTIIELSSATITYCIYNPKSDSYSNEEIIIGVLDLEESLCMLIEKEVMNNTEILSKYPYYLIEDICDKYNIKLKRNVLIYITFLSLLTSNPIKYFFNIIEFISDKFTNRENEDFDQDKILTQIVSKQQYEFNHLSDIILKSVNDLANASVGRGGSEYISKYFQEVTTTIIDLRKSNIVFDLDILMSKKGSNIQNISNLMSIVKPCDILFSKNEFPVFSAFNCDYYVSFNQIDNLYNSSFTLSELLCMYASERHMVLSHFNHNQIDQTNLIGHKCCPHYAFCTQTFRTENQQICFTSPWKSYGKANCWYSAGVLSLLGIVKVKSLE